MVSGDKKQVLEWFAKGRGFYKEADFKKAFSCFEKALSIDKTDGPSRVYYARCKMYITNPPPEDWDGVFVMTTK